MFRLTYASSLLITVMMIGSAFSLVKDHKEAQAQIAPIPFAGKIANIELCCNGAKVSLSHPPLSVAYGTFIFPWQNMVPIPIIGWGLFSQWSFTPGTTVLGAATPGGVCITVYSYCESSEVVTWTIMQMGTNLISSPIGS